MEKENESVGLNLNAQKTECIKNKWLFVSDIEKDILGRPNFACGQIAARMRKMGIDCPAKAESEQALVIFTMLEFYKNNGKDWKEIMTEWLKVG